jgi:hypothetical protein
MDELLRRVTEKRDAKNLISEETYKLRFERFLQEIYYNCDPNVYGLYPVKKIQRDSNNMFLEISNDKNIGDAHINKTEFFEVKVSFLPKKSNKYNIKNIRKYQNVDYYLIILVDDKFKSHIYCVPKDVICDNPILKLGYMSQTKEVNSQNALPLYSTTINGDEIEWILGRKNVLDGTSYSDLLEFIKKTYQKKSHPDNEITYPTKTVRNPISKVSFNVNGTKIVGHNNREAMVNLINHLGPKKMDGVIWESQLKKYPYGEVSRPINDGYYLNPKFSFRDIQKVVNQINIKTNNNVRIETN